MRAELTKAIELNPNFPESYSLLAFVNTVTGEDLEKIDRTVAARLSYHQDVRIYRCCWRKFTCANRSLIWQSRCLRRCKNERPQIEGAG